MTSLPLEERFQSNWPLQSMRVFLSKSPTEELSDQAYWTSHACFAPLNGSSTRDTYLFYKDDRLTTEFPDIIDPYYDAIYTIFPHVSKYKDKHGVWCFDFKNYDWHPSEFMYCASLLRYPIEQPWMMCSYSEWIKWGATPSQAILAAQYFCPKHWKEWKIGSSKNSVRIQSKSYGGHAVTLHIEEPTSLFGFDIPKITENIRNSNFRMSTKHTWTAANDYVRNQPLGKLSKDTTRTEKEFKSLLQPTFGKQNAHYYTL